MANEEIKVLVTDPNTGEPKEMTLVFQEGCFDSLIEAGISLEELEELKQQTIESFKSGQAFLEATPLTEEDEAELEAILSKRQTRQ